MSTATVRCLLVLALLSLTPGCATSSKRSASEPTPPKVDCELGTVSRPVPPLPAVWTRAGQLSVEGAEWIADALGIIRVERDTDARESDCLDRLRKAGVIR